MLCFNFIKSADDNTLLVDFIAQCKGELPLTLFNRYQIASNSTATVLTKKRITHYQFDGKKWNKLHSETKE